jgi:hypothetical protein
MWQIVYSTKLKGNLNLRHENILIVKMRTCDNIKIYKNDVIGVENFPKTFTENVEGK